MAGRDKESASGRSLLPQRNDVGSRISRMEALSYTRTATFHSLVDDEESGRKIVADPAPSLAVSPRQSINYSATISKKAPTTAQSSSGSIPKAMGPPRLLGRSQSVRRSDTVGTNAVTTSQGHKPPASITIISQVSSMGSAPATHRRDRSSTVPKVQFSSRSILGQASAAANQHELSVSHASGSGSEVTHATDYGSLKASKDARQRPETSNTQISGTATVGSQRPRNQLIPKGQDRDCKPHTRISSAPTEVQSKPRRQEFTTLQQNFTPKKGLKPSTASLIVPSLSKQPKVDILSAEAIGLQTELLQMHVLHQSSYTVQSQWEGSAENVFRQQYDELTGRYAGVRAKEQDAQERLNTLALMDWCQDHSDLPLVEKAQILSHAIQDVQNMTNPGGKYNRIIAVFEQWFAWASRLRQSREEHPNAAGQDMEFVEDIGDGWEAELAVLERKLASVARDFNRLGPAREGSSLAFVLTSLSRIITGMQDEIESIRIIETEVLTQEHAWVAGMIDNLTFDVGRGMISSESPIHKGIWQEAG